LLTALGDCRSALSSKQFSDSTPTDLSDHGGTEDSLLTPEELSVLCRHMNEQHWAAQQVQRASVELFQALFFRDRPENDPIRQADGIICQLRGNNGFVVLVSRFGIRGSVCVKDPQGQVAWMSTKSEDRHRIQWMPAGAGFEVERVYDSTRGDCGRLEVRDPRTGEVQRYSIFDHVTVEIHVTDSVTHGLGLRLQLIRGPHVTKDLSATKSITDGKQLDTQLIESVQDQDTKRRRKRALDEQAATADEMEALDQDVLIARLHEPGSMYHHFRKLLRECNPAQPVVSPGDE
uniref:Rrp44_S1 domain-containing protein n=1 Tax=Echinostoma caproni TaxID=27848 RepID=A0A183BBZ0_9TREM